MSSAMRLRMYRELLPPLSIRGGIISMLNAERPLANDSPTSGSPAVIPSGAYAVIILA